MLKMPTASGALVLVGGFELSPLAPSYTSRKLFHMSSGSISFVLRLDWFEHTAKPNAALTNTILYEILHAKSIGWGLSRLGSFLLFATIGDLLFGFGTSNRLQ